ncbi:protein sidekick isoform X2 [Daktulosphaira vitifoliae]|uniref:protein sidekick isoform X2 n=1 Tax=Daktulosphaira vitifoliae TaxID=58002 RepID=UPI0021A9C4DF|nr:protein sidekick isoform X2 [Daktulosphaira vitifoliae]
MEEEERYYIHRYRRDFLLTITILLAIFISSSQSQSLQPPRFITQPSSTKNLVSEGQTKMLQCQALGYPAPVYKWLKDGKELGEFSTDQTYRMLNTKQGDVGTYQCIAKNDVGSILSQKIDINIAYMENFKEIDDPIVKVERGHAAVLDCPPIKSYPPPLVQWQTDDGTQLYDIKYALVAELHQLVVLSASDYDQKAYRVRATNPQLGKEENSKFLRIEMAGGSNHGDIAPYFVVTPKEKHVIKGHKTTELQCIANARPIHELETLWFKDGIPIGNINGIVTAYNDPWNRTLSLINANLTYTGRYTCQVRFRSGGYAPISADADVFVLEPPAFVGNLRLETLGEYGSTVRLGCDTIGVPQPKKTWYRNTEAIGQNNRYTIEEDGTLVIKKLNIEDSGMFQCESVNEAGSDYISTWLKVKRHRFKRRTRISSVYRMHPWLHPSVRKLHSTGPMIENEPSNATVLEGNEVILSCRVIGAPKPNTTWIFGDLHLSPNEKIRILEQGDLFISSTRVQDTGKYTCIRSNEAGSVQMSAYIKVLGKTSIIEPPTDTKVLLGQTSIMKCRVSNDPTVLYQIDWFHNNKSIGAGNGRIKVSGDGTLEIGVVRASDAGIYTCSVSSPGGDERRHAYLSILELPYPPNVVQAERVGPRSVNVSWTIGFDGNSPILKYIIQKRQIETQSLLDPLVDWVTELTNISANSRFVILENLKAANTYQFRVSAMNAIGEGTPSQPSNFVTLPQQAPSGPPLGFVGSARSNSEIITQWQPPLEEHHNGQILGYVIRYRLHGYIHSPWTIHNITSSAQHYYLIQDLITWKDYDLQVAAYNNKGVGIFSESIRIKTKEGVPEATPLEVVARPLNSTSVQVWWKPPDPQKINGINQGYRLQAWIGERVEHEMTVAPSLFDPLAQQTTIFVNLRKFMAYNITVLCFTDPGDGPLSNPSLVVTHEDVPDLVGSLHFENVSDRSVTVVWTVPVHTNGHLIAYTVNYSIRDRPESVHSINTTSDITSIVVDQLQATTHYKFEVFAWTKVGPGPSRMATIQSGIEPVLPNPPSKLAITNIEPFSVVLQFTPGFDGNSSITKWVVEAQTARNTTWFTVHEESSPDASTLKVLQLVPYTVYRLRITAWNVVGASEPSEPTKDFQTIQAPPAHPPYNVTVRAMSSTELRVRWIPLQQSEWFGNGKGYNITYKLWNTSILQTVIIDDITSNSFVLDSLQKFTQYEITMNAFNDVGSSVPSPPAYERTRESVPSMGPVHVMANATSSTTIVVSWGDVPSDHRNGIIEGFKVYYKPGTRTAFPMQIKDIPKNSTFTTTLTELKKFVQYNIQVLAYSRLGEGALSIPPARVQTFEDVPGIPSNVSFPDVTSTTARVIWDVPTDPNGEILAYRVTYQLHNNDGSNYSQEFPASGRTFTATNLIPDQNYMFTITAQTRLGWGKSESALVFTSNNREIPQAPSSPQISRSQIQATQITFSWTPGRDGDAPLRYYTVQKSEDTGPWTIIPERLDPSFTSYTVQDLLPFTLYRFRIQATNDIGPSSFSHESPQVRTLSAPPSRMVSKVHVIPITTTSIRVSWGPVPPQYWNGDTQTGGYKVLYQPVSDVPVALQTIPSQIILGTKENSLVVGDLVRDRNYDIIVVPFNSQGNGPPSTPVPVYVGEAVPTGEPRSVTAFSVSSTEVRLSWEHPQQNQQNGDLLGYKIFYIVTDSPNEHRIEEETEVVPATFTSHSLVFLDKYTEYKIQILAFNPAGDGPRSTPVIVRTHQGVPGPPTDLMFSEITMNSLKVSWTSPKRKNGQLLGYIVTYETAEQNERFSKQVKQKVNQTWLLVQPLEEEVTYTFTVRAQTIDFGVAVRGNVTTGPQPGSPTSPRDLSLIRTVSSVDLKWVNGASGKGPILGYYVQSRRKDDTRWVTVTKSNSGPLDEFSVSYQSLLPSTSYLFRIVAYNEHGISYPAYCDDVVLTPSKLYLEYGYLQMKPFYRQTWFMVALAAASLVVLIMVIAILCVKSKSYKYKQEAQKTLEESMVMDIDDRQQLALELQRTRMSNNNTLSRMSMHNTLHHSLHRHKPPIGTLGKSPPRPSPASVPYHSDDDSVKGYDENPDDSSVTEKPSEISSTDSQGSESENESVRSDPHSFVNHYANVNDSLRQSWKRQKPVRNYSSYTDSEPEGSAVMSLNGGQIIMNNMARSRAPLPGFSSFV